MASRQYRRRQGPRRRCSPENGARQADELPLADAKVAATLCNMHAQALGIALDLCLETYHLERLPQRRIGKAAQRIEIEAQRPAKENGVLWAGRRKGEYTAQWTGDGAGNGTSRAHTTRHCTLPRFVPGE